MGIQDDYFDVAAYMEDNNVPKYVVEAFENIWDRFCSMESELGELWSNWNTVQKFMQLVRDQDDNIPPA
jgi:hypothetical protein